MDGMNVECVWNEWDEYYLLVCKFYTLFDSCYDNQLSLSKQRVNKSTENEHVINDYSNKFCCNNLSKFCLMLQENNHVFITVLSSAYSYTFYFIYFTCLFSR